jgi:hypothetical protein
VITLKGALVLDIFILLSKTATMYPGLNDNTLIVGFDAADEYIRGMSNTHAQRWRHYDESSTWVETDVITQN